MVLIEFGVPSSQASGEKLHVTRGCQVQTAPCLLSSRTGSTWFFLVALVWTGLLCSTLQPRIGLPITPLEPAYQIPLPSVTASQARRRLGSTWQVQRSSTLTSSSDDGQMDGVVPTLADLVLVSDALEPYVLTFQPNGDLDGAIETNALVVMKRAGGVLLAVFSEAGPEIEIRRLTNWEVRSRTASS